MRRELSQEGLNDLKAAEGGRDPLHKIRMRSLGVSAASDAASLLDTHVTTMMVTSRFAQAVVGESGVADSKQDAHGEHEHSAARVPEEEG